MSLRSISLAALCLFANIARVNADSPDDAVAPTTAADAASTTAIADRYCHWQVDGAHPIICPTENERRSLTAEEIAELYATEEEAYLDNEELAAKPKHNRTRKHAKGSRRHGNRTRKAGKGRHRNNGTRLRKGQGRGHRKNNGTFKNHGILPRPKQSVNRSFAKGNGTARHRGNGTRHSNPLHRLNGTRHKKPMPKMQGQSQLQGMDVKPAMDFDATLGMKGKVPGAGQAAGAPAVAARAVPEEVEEEYEDVEEFEDSEDSEE